MNTDVVINPEGWRITVVMNMIEDALSYNGYVCSFKTAVFIHFARSHRFTEDPDKKQRK